jgi:hypothetical protein
MSAQDVSVVLILGDDQDVGRLRFIDGLASDPRAILRILEGTMLDIGVLGGFDDNSLMALSAIRDGARLRFYRAGWQRTPGARSLPLTGPAFGDDDGETFARHQSTMRLERGPSEFLVRSPAFVFNDEGRWKARYAAGSTAVAGGGRNDPPCCLADAGSRDSSHGPASGHPVIVCATRHECVFGRPRVVRRVGIHRLAASIRTRSKICRNRYVLSDDGPHRARP